MHHSLCVIMGPAQAALMRGVGRGGGWQAGRPPAGHAAVGWPCLPHTLPPLTLCPAALSRRRMRSSIAVLPHRAISGQGHALRGSRLSEPVTCSRLHGGGEARMSRSCRKRGLRCCGRRGSDPGPRLPGLRRRNPSWPCPTCRPATRDHTAAAPEQRMVADDSQLHHRVVDALDRCTGWVGGKYRAAMTRPHRFVLALLPGHARREGHGGARPFPAPQTPPHRCRG